MDLIRWFQGLEGLPAILVIVAYFVFFAMALTYASRAICARAGIVNNPSSVSPAISVTGTMMSILIGLVIVSLWNDYRLARTNLNAEATELRGAAREVQLLAPKAAPMVIADLRTYARIVSTDEWTAMEHGSASNGAGRALGKLLLDANETRTPTFDLRPRVSRLAELRTFRINQTSSSIVGLLWFALLIIPVLVLAGISLLNDLRRYVHYTLAGLAAVAISIAVFVALELDLPYSGTDGLGPAPIAAAVDQAITETR